MPDFVVVPDQWQGLYPVSYGFEACTPMHSFGPYIRSYYLLHYIFEGCGTFEKAGQLFSLQAGDMFVIEPGEVTTYRADKERPWVYCWLGFQSAHSLPFLHRASFHQPPVRDLFLQIRELEQAECADAQLFGLMYYVLYRLSRQLKPEVRAVPKYAAYARTWLETQYMRPLRIEQLAERLHIDRHYLTRLFSAEYGVPPKQYLTEFRLRKAKEFLQQGYSVSQSSSLAGFPDLSNFSRAYKRTFGCCPRVSHMQQASAAAQEEQQ